MLNNSRFYIKEVTWQLDPVIFTLGSLEIRWYGVLVATSILIGFYYFLRDGKRLSINEDLLYNVLFVAVIGGMIGARLVYVLTNLSVYLEYPAEIIRIDHGGLSFHGAVLGGFLTTWLYIRKKRVSLMQLFDLVIPGLCVGIILVRLANILNQEAMGRMAGFLGTNHPAQLYASFLGLVLLIIHNVIARSRPPVGYLSWSFIFYYSLFRFLIEETCRDNPLYLWGYVNEYLGIGFFTLTHLISVPIMILALWQRSRIMKRYVQGRIRR
jgi:phosphatidylglycerol:prolipoprotein diacylglycerol transferase